MAISPTDDAESAERSFVLLASDEVAEAGALAEAIGQALDAAPRAAVLVRNWQPGSAVFDALHPICRKAGVACLAEPAKDAPLTQRLDGALLSADPHELQQARRLLGADAILGARCGLSRHDAMIAGEAGADFIAFEGSASDPALLAVLAWWSDLFVLPTLALVAEPDDVAARLLAKNGADFLAVPAALWSGAGGAENLARLADAFV
ncbi:thiamine phosphate synthase [Marinivivus vitaminiproducens]|uniref:thiamine phosphate synthase n=1 Tax=Marinivivus vitaminiproducens TaxID=3035935 RepID=UPI00279F956B|nr:thiamine phosphate synthase [Geminicoccaceae bacterium SCSIO 64248]